MDSFNINVEPQTHNITITKGKPINITVTEEKVVLNKVIEANDINYEGKVIKIDANYPQAIEAARIATEKAEEAKEVVEGFDAHAAEKITEYDANASDKIAAYNANAVEKTDTFNSNATSKTTAFNENASSKTGDFNTNASAKTTEFNDNATSKTNTFNQNATDKTTAFNNNASEKTTAFNDNYTEKKAVIDSQVQLAKDWATKTDGKVDGVDYSSKYWAQQILPIASDITTVAGIASDVTAVKNNATNINTVAGDSSAINTVAGISTEVSTVAGIDTDITTVSGISSDVTSVASNSTDISAVASDLTNIGNVASDLTNIDSVAGNIANVNAVADDLANINAVNSNKTNIDAVAGDLTNINAVAGDLTNINNASTYADNANIWAEGSDAQVQALGGVHSSKGWAEQSAQGQVQSNWAETDTTAKSYIQNKPTLGTMASESASDYTKTSGLATVAISGSYADLSNKPTVDQTYSASSTNAQSGTAVASAISGKADDSDVVKLTGNQTIGGVKTFTNSITTYQNGRYIRPLEFKNIAVTDNDNPASSVSTEIALLAGTNNVNNYLGCFGFAQNPDGSHETYLRTGNAVSGTFKEARLTLHVNSDGTAYGLAPTPATSDNSQKIATTAFVKSNLANYQPLLTSGTNIKTINGNSLLGSGDIDIVANTDLSNLTSQGQNIANWSSNVTNCITEIPQDIKLELNNGVIIKTGSKVYIPNGANTFNAVTIGNDISGPSGWASQNEKQLLLYDGNNNVSIIFPRDYCFSGATAPTSYLAGLYGIWYDITNNVVKWTTDGGNTWTGGYSLPLGIVVETTSGGVIDKIDQVFNGFGYIGSTVFALPRFKGLVANGRNEDGSLKSTLISYTVVKVATSTGNNSGNRSILFDNGGIVFGGNEWYYDEQSNYVTNGTTNINYFIGGSLYLTNDKISNWNPKTVFHALDYNDSPTISGWSMPSSRYIELTLGASDTTYTAPANGWAMVTQAFSGSCYIGLATVYPDKDGICMSSHYNSAAVLNAYISVSKGKTFKVFYGGTKATNSANRFEFIYAEGENV